MLADQLIRTGPDRLAHEPVGSGLLVIFCRNHPAGTAHIRGAEQDGEIGKGFFEVKADGIGANDLDAVGFRFQDVTPGAAVVLVAPFDIRRGHRRPVVKLAAVPQP